MKRLLLLITLGLMLVACGKDYKTYTYEQKEEIYTKAKELSKKGDAKLLNELKELEKKLKELAKNGDNTAEKEYEEWHDVRLNYHDPDMWKDTKPVDFKNRTW